MDEPKFTSEADAAAFLAWNEGQVKLAEARRARTIAALCDLHRVDETIAVEGAEQWIQVGAAGTPMVGEFIAGEIAALLGISKGSAFLRMAEVLNLRHRHPTLWREFLSGTIREWDATRVATLAAQADLDEVACARFDKLCATALRIQPWSRVRRNVNRWLIEVDPAKARERREARARERYARVGRIEDGHVQWWGQVDAADGIAFDQALDHIARDLEGDTADERRASAIGVMARRMLSYQPLPTAGARPRRGRAEMVVRVDAADLSDPGTGVADIDCWGPVLADQLATLLADAQVTVRPIVMPSSTAGVDGYRVPVWLRRFVETRNPVDVFPFGTTPAGACEMDHTVAYDHDDPAERQQTRADNLGPLSKYSHRLKTHGGWQLIQIGPGVFRWRSPLGFEYRCTPQGTQPTRRPPPPTPPSGSARPRPRPRVDYAWAPIRC